MFSASMCIDKEPTDYQKASKDLMTEIFAVDYYSSRFTNQLNYLGMSKSKIENFQYSHSDLNHLWNEFWFSLPDEEYIRTPTFFKLCDLCEQ
mgnify:CR=1 FL=1